MMEAPCRRKGLSGATVWRNENLRGQNRGMTTEAGNGVAYVVNSKREAERETGNGVSLKAPKSCPQ